MRVQVSFEVLVGMAIAMLFAIFVFYASSPVILSASATSNAIRAYVASSFSYQNATQHACGCLFEN